MRRPPPNVVLVARTHWVVAAAVLIATGVLTWATEKFPVEFGVRTYAIVLSIAGFYLLAGTLVWFGAPLGRVCSRVACLLYLARPRLGSELWVMMSSEEFRGHFARRKEPAGEDSPPTAT